MIAPPATNYPQGKHRYRSVADGMAMAQRFLSSGLGASAFARQYGVSLRMVKYWSGRAQMLASASTAAAETPPPLLEHVASVETAPVPSTPLPEIAPTEQVAPPASSAESRIEITMPGGARVVVVGSVPPALLRQAVRCLWGRQC